MACLFLCKLNVHDNKRLTLGHCHFHLDLCYDSRNVKAFPSPPSKMLFTTGSLISMLFMALGKVSQSQRGSHFGPDNSLLRGNEFQDIQHFYGLHTSSTSLSCDHQKCLQTLQNVPEGQHHHRWITTALGKGIKIHLKRQVTDLADWAALSFSNVNCGQKKRNTELVKFREIV